MTQKTGTESIADRLEALGLAATVLRGKGSGPPETLPRGIDGPLGRVTEHHVDLSE